MTDTIGILIGVERRSEEGVWLRRLLTWAGRKFEVKPEHGCQLFIKGRHLTMNLDSINWTSSALMIESHLIRKPVEISRVHFCQQPIEYTSVISSKSSTALRFILTCCYSTPGLKFSWTIKYFFNVSFLRRCSTMYNNTTQQRILTIGRSLCRMLASFSELISWMRNTRSFTTLRSYLDMITLYKKASRWLSVSSFGCCAAWLYLHQNLSIRFRPESKQIRINM